MTNQEEAPDLGDAVEDLDLPPADAEKVVGGEITQDVTVNKAKTADKASSAMDGYIRG